MSTITVQGNYVYINDLTIGFVNEEKAEEFVIKLIKEGVA